MNTQIIDILQKLSNTNDPIEKKIYVHQLLHNFPNQNKTPIEVAIENKLYHIALLLLKYDSPLPRKSPFNFYNNRNL
ncbi:MAG: hypothetical protein WC108_08560, partial [Bacteroidales bacterium]